LNCLRLSSAAPGFLQGLEVRQLQALAVGFRDRQGFDLLHRAVAAPDEIVINAGAVDLPVHFEFGEFAHHLGRHSAGQHARGNFETRLDEALRRDDRRFADDGLVHHHGVHADHAVLAHDAAMQDGAMADVAIFLDDGVAAGKAVHYTAVLHVGAGTDEQATEVAAQAGTGTDVGARTDVHVTDQHGRRMNIGARIDHRHDAVDCIDFHWVNAPQGQCDMIHFHSKLIHASVSQSKRRRFSTNSDSWYVSAVAGFAQTIRRRQE
jgi:hypothetical protein